MNSLKYKELEDTKKEIPKIKRQEPNLLDPCGGDIERITTREET